MAILIKSIDEAFLYKENNPSCILVLEGDKANIYSDIDINPDMLPPVIKLPAHKAQIMLHKIGKLIACQDICKNIGPEAEISFNKAPEIHSDNPLVLLVLSQIGLSETQIYNLFVEAQ